MAVTGLTKRDLHKLNMRVQYFRKLRGISKEELAILSDVSETVISSIEAQGMFTDHGVTNYIKLARGLKLSSSELFDLFKYKEDDFYGDYTEGQAGMEGGTSE